MRRSLLNLLTALSLVVCVAVLALWVRSRFFQDSFAWERVEHRGHYRVSSRYVLHTYRGGVEISGSVYGEGRGAEVTHAAAQPATWASGPPRPSFHFPRHALTVANRLGFLLENDDVARDALRDTFRGGWMLAIPYWAPLLFAAVLPAASLSGWRRRRRWMCAGLCPSCGYDLRATPGRCPECGTPASAGAKA